MCGILAVGSLGTGDQRWRWARVALPRGQAQRRVVEEEKRNRRRRKNRDGARQKEQNRNIGILMQWWWCIGILMQCGFEQWEPFCSPGGKCLAFCILHAFVICCDTVSSVSHQYHVLAQVLCLNTTLMVVSGMRGSLYHMCWGFYNHLLYLRWSNQEITITN